MTLKLAYYADDFTGSTDALEFLTRAGARTVLFVKPPSEVTLGKYGELDAIGVAGLTRSMTPDRMEERLLEDFSSLNELGPRHVHYKVCSTFDSSPEIGSIGRAIEVGRRFFKNQLTPVVVGTPALGRYVAFGNLFARMGIGSQGKIFRLDRHPSARRHPVTPMREADLVRHLQRQTRKSIGLIDFKELESDNPWAVYEQRIAEGYEAVVLDTLSVGHLDVIGDLLDELAEAQSVFSVGSSGVEVALGSVWKRSGALSEKEAFEALEPVSNLLVVSGSCSPVTDSQIEHATRNGFAEVALDTSLLTSENGRQQELSRVVEKSCSHLEAGRPAIVHTARGAEDPRITRTQKAFSGGRIGRQELKERSGEWFGSALGEVAKECIQRTGIKRLLVAGGDSSSFAARAMGIEAVEMLAPLCPGAPVCRAFAPGSPVDGIELNFKGGQVGDETYFSQVANGKI
ncbi:four-carbon acid sugar kinase family protein [Pelagicoccus sp. NFK12]|uniref:Four-carbon acid sugar kinase family protein n=1 Tax=Pelagicoccus enzymogenes TaxID=2773457 RepID=A0A927F8S5_9BACT|nr:four-carbon acid sugar kinase family protein [Pelagicoccus enzymogenes]MBD5780429.1 four-carbon acid sugar kinase family protein [Pelagicoccus enzymogenes]